MAIKVYIPNFLIKVFNGEKMIECSPGRLSDILESISKKYPVFKSRFLNSDGRLKDYVTLFIDNKIINSNDLASINIEDNQKIKIYI